MMIAYVCDRQKECRTSPSCGTVCRHTMDIGHALYDTHSDLIAYGDGIFEEREKTLACDRAGA